MACINKNLEEFKELSLSFPNERTAYALATMWQRLNKDDRIPTYEEIKEMQKQQKREGKKKKDTLKTKLMTNLQSLGLVNNINGKYFLNVTSKDFGKSIINKITKIKNFLSWNNISPSFIDINTKDTNAEIKFNYKAISDTSSILNQKEFNKGKTRKILDYLLPKFPGIGHEVVSVADAKVLYDAIPNELKEDVDFKRVKSFFNPVSRNVVLIKSRVTDDIAIEEILHPLVAAINLENQELFKNLSEEAKKNYPELFKKIQSHYTEGVEEELVTQAMVKYFKKEYEKKPSRSLINYIKQALKWFQGHIKKLFSKVSGEVLPVKAISKDSTFSDIAKLLNTDSLIFEYNLPEKMRVKYALSENKEAIIKDALYRSKTLEQKTTIEALFKNVRESSQEYNQFTATDKEADPFTERIVILEEEGHIYKNRLNENEEFVSVTSTYNAFKGEEEDYEFNKAMGNIFDSILEAQILGLKDDALYSNLENNPATPLELLGDTKEEQQTEIDKIFNGLQGLISGIISRDEVLLPQVIVHSIAKDKENFFNIAGAIDLLVVTPEGKLKVIDLKTSRDSVTSEKHSSPWSIEGTLLNEASKKTGRKEQKKLSKKQKHTLQLAVYSSILENMGFEMDHEQPYFTINFRIDVKGERKEQKYQKKFTSEGKNAERVEVKSAELNQHPSSIQERLASYLVESRKKVTPKAEYLEPEAVESEPVESFVTLNSIESKLKEYAGILIKRKEAIEEMRNKLFFSEYKKPLSKIRKIDMVLSMISNAIESNSIGEMNQAYTEVLSTAIRETDKFINYLEDPVNRDELDYIVYVQNAKQFAEQFRSLYLLRDSDNVNPTIEKLINRLSGKLNTLVENNGENLSVANAALFSFVRKQIEDNSTQEFTEKELDLIMRESRDISMHEYLFRDLATSRDVHLRVMNKIMHNAQMKIMDRVQERENTIRSTSRKLMLLSGNKTAEEIYDFMLYDDGTYIRKHSKEFTALRREKRMNLFDEEGNWKQYIKMEDVNDFTQEQIDYNIELSEAKKAYAEFMKAEELTADGTVKSGKYYEYTEEFIKEREKYEELRISKHGYIYWQRQGGISDRIWNNYEKKYYGRRNYRTIVSVNGVPTAQTVEKENVRYVKSQWKKIKDTDSEGNPLLDKRYVKLHKPENELEQAQLEFYKMFVKEFEDGLLRKLPPGIRAKMLGRIPVRRNKFATYASRQPTGVMLIWTKFLDSLRSIKEFFTNTTNLRAVTTDEFGNLVDSIPIFFTGSLKDEKLLEEIDEKIEALKKKRENKETSFDEFKIELAKLRGRRKMIEARPNQNELSRDLGTSLLHFSRMAENYEKMSEAENVFNAIISVIENKSFQPAGPLKLGHYSGKKFVEKGQKLGKESNVYKRAKAFMNMIVYDKDKIDQTKIDKLANGFMKYTSLSYVSMNPFGSFNNYLFGKLSNYNEAWGGRFFSAKSYHWAELEYKSKGIKGWIDRASSNVGYDDILDAGSILIDPESTKKTIYDPKNPLNKYEAMVDFWRMEDKKGDLREASFEFGENTWKEKLTNFAYKLQDLGEHVNQSKIGMAILKDFIIQDKDGKMPEISLYDAYNFNPNEAGDLTNRGLQFKKGYEKSVIIKAPGQFKFDDAIIDSEIRYNIRSYIRETNKQIHGNYADKDRMVIQAHTLGKLFSQFHRWVAPAFHARFQKEYYDENLGWMEGRYRSALKMFRFIGEKVIKMDLDFKDLKKQYIEYENETRKEDMTDERWKQVEQKIDNKFNGFKRTSVEIGLILLIMAVNELMKSLMDDDDDEDLGPVEYTSDSFDVDEVEKSLALFSNTAKRTYNWARWQLDRTLNDFKIFMPVWPSNIEQLVKMIDSPMASTRTMGEFAEALSYTFAYPLGYLTNTEEELLANKDYYYQRGNRKGQSKLSKNWGDAVPLWYSLNKWISFDSITNFHIK